MNPVTSGYHGGMMRMRKVLTAMVLGTVLIGASACSDETKDNLKSDASSDASVVSSAVDSAYSSGIN